MKNGLIGLLIMVSMGMLGFMYLLILITAWM